MPHAEPAWRWFHHSQLEETKDQPTPVPHHLFIQHRGLCLTGIAASFLLSLWAISVDPVINLDGILYVNAAKYAASGNWGQALSVHQWPFYSITITLVSAITNLSITHSAYFTSAVLYALLVLGFVGIVYSLGAGSSGLWFAVAVSLLHPAFNEFRAFIIRDVGYWAFYLWGLAYFFSYIRHQQRRLLLLAIVMATGAFLFRVEGIVFLIVVLTCLLAHNAGWNQRNGTVLVVAVAVVVSAAVSFPLWQHKNDASMAFESLLANPLDYVASSWHSIKLELVHRLNALGREFPALSIPAFTFFVYLTTSVAMLLFETIESLGVVYTGLVIYAVFYAREVVPPGIRAWWWTLIGVQGLLIFGFAFLNFFLADRYCVALAMTLLVIVPLLLDRLWSSWLQEKTSRHNRWIPLIAVLLLIEGAEGLDVRTEKQYLREAGLWLRANAAQGSTLYTNDRIVAYYAGLKETDPNREYSWQEAMSEAWTGKWRNHDYFALVMTGSSTQNEVLLLQQIGAGTLNRFTNERGDKVLIFRGNGTGK